MSTTTPEQEIVQAPEQETTVRPTPVDYFGFASNQKWYFPDGEQYIEFAIMNEGKKSEFQKMTQRDLVIERQTQNARMKVDPSIERHELIRKSVVDWYMFRDGRQINFNEKNLAEFLRYANPVIIEDLEKAIRKANPWLLAEMSVADIDREIENLQEMRAVAVEREAGEASSSSR